jgi:hypothetical protein
LTAAISAQAASGRVEASRDLLAAAGVDAGAHFLGRDRAVAVGVHGRQAPVAADARAVGQLHGVAAAVRVEDFLAGPQHLDRAARDQGQLGDAELEVEGLALAAEGPAETRRLLLAAANELADGRIVSGYGLASRVKAAPCIAAPLAEALGKLKEVKLAEDEHYAEGEKLQKAMGHMGQARALWQEAQRQGHDEAARLAKAEYDKGKAQYDAGRGALVPRVRRLNALRERLPGVRKTLETLAEKKC